MRKKLVKGLYWFVAFFVWLFSPKMKVVGAENLPEEPSLVVGNHSQSYGPIACEFYFPGKHYIWAAGAMMKLKDVPSYAFQDFWSFKPKRTHWFYKILSYLIAPISILVFNYSHTIGVYRDSRIMSTFKNTVMRLQQGNNVVIFPEHNVKCNHIIYDFQDRFIDVAKLYYKKTGKQVSFVPLYIAPKLKTMYIGKPIRFQADQPIEQERRRICEYLMSQITDMACDLPEHTVIPYRNIPKKDYPTNKRQEVPANEEACC